MSDVGPQVGERFEIRSKLGQGAMGVVYEAFDRERQETVALKALRRADGLQLARFKREFHALHDLSHPNLVALGELFDRGSAPFFTMELVRGRDLLSYVQQRDEAQARVADTLDGPVAPGSWSESTQPGPRPIQPIPFDEPRLRSALRQLALGIAALHRAGRIHRDVKPSNTLVTADGRLVLLDFGLVTEHREDLSRSSASEVVGTVSYMAPEQAASAEIGPAADWYSFGAVLFEALTGVVPFRGRTAFEVLIKKQEQPAPPPRQLLPAVPPDLDDLCWRLLSINPADRPQERDIFERLGIDATQEHLRATTSLVSRGTTSASFVGRTAELGRLRAAYQRSRVRAVIVLVEGESGVGKTQLVDTFLRQLADEEPDAVILAGRCYEREVVSYKAFDGIAEALARHLTRLPAVEAAALLPLEPSRVARLFPVLKRVASIAAAPFEPDLPDPLQQRQRMFGALRELFLRLRERHRMVWFIDDLQWADADSFVLLQELIAHEDPLPVLLVATTRPVADRSRQDLLARVSEQAATERMCLDNLSAEDARVLAELLLPGQPSAVLDTVAADAGGHPLFLHELARHLGLEAGAVAGATLDEMMASRIAQLSTPARRLLEVVSLFGGPMTQQVAALAADQSDAEQAKVARVLQAAHLVRTEGVHRADHIVAYHDRVREHVTERLAPERRRAIHERLAVALEQSGAAALDPRALVRHAGAAGLDSLAATHALRAARQAVASLAFDQAAEFFTTALHLGRHDEPGARALRIELAEALVNAGRGPEAAMTFLDAAERAEPSVRLDCHRRAAEQWILTGHIERGLDAMRASLADIDVSLAPTPRRAQLEVLWNRTLLRARGMRYTLRRESQVAEETLRRIDVVRAVALGLSVVDNVRGAAFNGRFIRMALRAGEPTRLVQAMCAESTYLASQGGRAGQRARALHAEVSRLASTLPGELFVATWLHGAGGMLKYFEDRFTAAAELLAKCEAATMISPRATTFERNTARVFRLLAIRQLGALGRGRALFAESMRSARQRGDRYIESSLRRMCNLEILGLGDTEGARRSLTEARWAPPEAGFHVQHWYELRSRAELAIYEGTAAEALTALAPQFEGLRRSMLLRVQVVRCMSASLRGRLLLAALAAGRGPEGARAEVARLAQQLTQERLGSGDVYALLLRAGLASLDRGPAHPDVVKHLRAAAQRAQELEMALHLAAARERLGAILGAGEGERLRASTAAYVEAEAIRVPARMFEVVAPGLDRG